MLQRRVWSGGWIAAAVLLVGLAQVGFAGTLDGVQTSADTSNETRMTKDQAKDLFRSVDEILGFVSSDTKLPIEHSVKRKLISRDEVNHYLKAKFDEDESAKRMERSEIVLKKFGLLDRDFHLRPFLLALLTEQIAGFYDNKKKTMNLPMMATQEAAAQCACAPGTRASARRLVWRGSPESRCR